MGDFEQVGTASLWKSGPLFSTVDHGGGAHDEGLWFEPAVAARVISGAFRGGQESEWIGGHVDPRLSTGFAERRGAASTGMEGLILGCGPGQT
jgi:hypothetical protein